MLFVKTYNFNLVFSIASAFLIGLFAVRMEATQIGAGYVCHPSAGIYFPNPLACESYLVCDHNIYLLRPCPKGLHWNRVALTCDWPQSAKCTLSSDSGPELSTSQPALAPTQPGDACDVGDHSNNVGLYRPHPTDCKQYLTCLHGKFVARPCSGNLHWNPKAETCDFPKNANCSHTIVTESPSVPITSTPSTTITLLEAYPGDKCVAGQFGSYRSHPTDCSQYLVCLHGVYVSQSCGNLHWNAREETCDRPEKAGCTYKTTTKYSSPSSLTSSATTTSITITTNAPIHSICVSDQSPIYQKQIFPHPICEMFYYCKNGRLLEHPCPIGLQWNQLLTTCDWPFFSGCVQGAAPIQPGAIIFQQSTIQELD